MQAINEALMTAMAEGERAAADVPADMLVERIRVWRELGVEAVVEGDAEDALFYTVASGSAYRRASQLLGAPVVDRHLAAEVIG